MDRQQSYSAGEQQQLLSGTNSDNYLFGPRGGFTGPPPPVRPPPLSGPWNDAQNNNTGPFLSGPNAFQHPPPPHWPPFPPTPQFGSHFFPHQLGFDCREPPPGYYEQPQSGSGPAFSETQWSSNHGLPPSDFVLEHGRQTNQWSHTSAGTQSDMGVSDVKGPFDQNLMLSSSRRQSYQSRFLSRHSTDSCHQNFLGDSARSPRDVTDQQYCHPLDKGGDADLVQRRRDEEWLKTFLFRRKRSPVLPKPIDSRPSISQFREKLYSAVKLVAELSATCETLKHNLENETVWTETYSKAVTLKSGLQDKLNSVCDPLVINTISKKLVKIRKKRIQAHRRKLERIEEKHREEARSAEREAAIDKWRTRCILVVEEKKREQELKLAADAVLSEVRRKQADAKRMLDILKSLEKLRKLRKEAASRKGIFPEKECDESFEEHVGRLRDLIRKRTAVYGAEERALRVMLEGEQEENRKRELEKRQKKERERLQQKRQELEMALFGAELPPDHPLQPFHDYYTQAEHSLPALIQIRKEWDLYLVPFDHPDGSSVPHTWVFPDPPADEIWATALDK